MTFSDTYEILAAGVFEREQVDQREVKSSRTVSSGEWELVSSRWEKALQHADQSGKSLYDSPLFRLERCCLENERIVLEYSRTSYRAYAMTRDVCSAKPWSGNADPVGSALIVRTSDGFIPFGKRSQAADVNPGKLFSFGGFFDIEDSDETGSPDIFLCAQREWEEETGITLDLHSLKLISVVYDLVHPHPEVAFFADLKVSADEVARSNWATELDELQLIKQAELADFVTKNTNSFTDSLLGALEVYCEFIG